MAETSSCVIVGRCADEILKEYNPFKIFVYADERSKLMRCKNRSGSTDGLTDKQIKKKMKEIDKHRAKYYTFFTGKTWGDKLNYDVCVNTTDADIDKIVDYLAKALQ